MVELKELIKKNLVPALDSCDVVALIRRKRNLRAIKFFNIALGSLICFDIYALLKPLIEFGLSTSFLVLGVVPVILSLPIMTKVIKKRKEKKSQLIEAARTAGVIVEHLNNIFNSTKLSFRDVLCNSVTLVHTNDYVPKDEGVILTDVNDLHTDVLVGPVARVYDVEILNKVRATLVCYALKVLKGQILDKDGEELIIGVSSDYVDCSYSLIPSDDGKTNYGFSRVRK